MRLGVRSQIYHLVINRWKENTFVFLAKPIDSGFEIDLDRLRIGKDRNA
jgi:hypothetical protein